MLAVGDHEFEVVGFEDCCDTHSELEVHLPCDQTTDPWRVVQTGVTSCLTCTATTTANKKEGLEVWNCMPSPSPWSSVQPGSTLCKRCYDIARKALKRGDTSDYERLVGQPPKKRPRRYSNNDGDEPVIATALQASHLHSRGSWVAEAHTPVKVLETLRTSTV